MNSDMLNTFIQLADYKNYTQTANSLFVAQSTVTNRILELEAELGKPLFIRSKKQLQLTQEGEHFLIYAKRILELENLARKEINSLNQYKHSIRIGTTNTIYDCYLANKTVTFVNNNPDIKMNITIGHSLPLLQMLLDKAIDIAFTYVPCHKREVTCSTFRKEQLILVTHKLNLIYKNGITQKELEKIPYYYCDFTFQEVGSYIKDLFPKGHPFPFEIDRSANLLPYLKSGTGYSFLPASLVNQELQSEELIQIPILDFTIPEICSYVITATKVHNYECIQKYIGNPE
ncbi:MAG TPA: LysR family transcriptional regulator [Mobilitalea sp.]|nr:LysR family transcriptional regulator [Mobilitalea sp.]